MPLYDMLENNSILNFPNDENLNVNGRKYYRHPEKSIWSYNPEDTSLNVKKNFFSIVSL